MNLFKKRQKVEETTEKNNETSLNENTQPTDINKDEASKEENFDIDTKNEEAKEELSQEITKEPFLKKYHKQGKIITSLISVIATIVFIFIPFINGKAPFDFFKIDFQNITTESLMIIIAFSVLLISGIIGLYIFFDALAHHNKESFPKKIDNVFIFNFIVSICYGLWGIVLLFVDLFTSKTGLVCFSYILTIIQIIVLIANSVINSYLVPDYIVRERYENEEEMTTYERIKAIKRPFPSIEQLIYTIIFSLLPIAVLFVDLFTVYSDGELVVGPIKAIDFLTKMGQLTNAGYRIMAFIFFICLLIDGIFLIASIVTFISKKKSFYKVSMAGNVINFCFVCFVSIYGLYYGIVQASVTANIQTLLQQFYPDPQYEPIIEALGKTEVKTASYIIALAAIAFLIYTLVRNPSRYSLIYDQLENEAISEDELNASILSDKPLTEAVAGQGGGRGGNGPSLSAGGNSGSGNEAANSGKDLTSAKAAASSGPLDVNVLKRNADEEALDTFDACPAFTELDGKADQFNKDFENREKTPFKGTSLPSLISFVVDYAKNSRLHLSYSKEDIAAFVAGLGCTRLTILQGMSGTGKTSLPKIFMEALYGNCELIEIESSWREKNELLGFYNEFSKIYTPKKFTQCLYKAALNPNIITMIVLDEMNLSRIEYYFSDFLSLMENEEDKRQIKLSNIKLYNTFDKEKHSYLKLQEDHTLKIPSNVWFIGTANRDESTFEISDKVYDRAHTMNFNKRAPAIKEFDEEMAPQFLKYGTFATMLKNAEAKYSFDIEKDKTIKEVERLMIPFNISFGNRIYNQIEKFVKIYCSCFKNPSEREFEAVETILLTKVVMKLENKNIDNRDALISEFKKLKLTRCVDFISKLSEDF